MLPLSEFIVVGGSQRKHLRVSVISVVVFSALLGSLGGHEVHKTVKLDR